MKVSDLWFRDQTHTWHVTIDGKQHNLRTSDKTAAMLAFSDLIRGVSEPGGSEPVTLHQLRAQFLESLVGTRADKTVRWYRFALDDRDGYKLPNWNVAKINDDVILKWLNSKVGDKPLVRGSDSTRNGILRAMHRMLEWAKQSKLIDSNPMNGLFERLAGVLPAYQPAVKTLEPEQIDALLTACLNPPGKYLARTDIHDVLFMLRHTGARPFEIWEAEAKYLKNGVLVIPVARAKCKRKERRIVLHGEALAMVEKLAKLYPTGKLFRRRNGKDWNSTTLCHEVATVRRWAGVDCSAKVLRHTFASVACRNGENLAMIATAMGHSDVTMIARVYNHPDDDAIRKLNQRTGEAA